MAVETLKVSKWDNEQGSFPLLRAQPEAMLIMDRAFLKMIARIDVTARLYSIPKCEFADNSPAHSPGSGFSTLSKSEYAQGYCDVCPIEIASTKVLLLLLLAD